MKLSSLARCVTWLSLPRRTGPIRDDWGFGRGTPVDRWYIERFLADHASDVHGDVLEVMDDRYTRRYGANVRTSTVLDITPENARATLVGDLEKDDALPASAYDCIVLTQTLQYVFDLNAAIGTLHRALRPGGVCLATVPTISRLDPAARETGEYWRLTSQGVARLFGDRFGADQVEVSAHGNARVAVAFLLGLAAEDLNASELVADNASFPLLVTVRAVRAT